ncbi:hypothetical protein EVAR_81678_1 [Eumeta japonica]|uniref:Uncharacterized protein n=1 Tax=Eumeta variegata TaxID=151549 RepID=A0A4C1V247_EUMVA|nr:hypothetical protein EVAR_81678_1 [Eumeta japonica]
MSRAYCVRSARRCGCRGSGGQRRRAGGGGTRPAHVRPFTLHTLISPIPRRCCPRHDRAMPHSPVEVETWLKDMFENNCIARYGPRRWPPRAPDPLDFFLWSFIKI